MAACVKGRVNDALHDGFRRVHSGILADHDRAPERWFTGFVAAVFYATGTAGTTVIGGFEFVPIKLAGLRTVFAVAFD